MTTKNRSSFNVITNEKLQNSDKSEVDTSINYHTNVMYKKLLNFEFGDIRALNNIEPDEKVSAILFRNAFYHLYDNEIMNTLLFIKDTIDKKVYDRNDILKKDAYFEQTVMTQITEGMDILNVANTREDRLFIQTRIASQYLNQYHSTYA